MNPSIEDVARLAGVSIATVSRSLRGLPEVAEATRSKVLAAARELDYVASPFAARLASGRTGTIGVVVPFIDRWYFGQVLGGLEGVLQHSGFDLLLYNLADMGRRERFFTEVPARKRVDALIIVSLVLNEFEVAALRGLGCPVGVLGVASSEGVSTVIDDHGGAMMAVEHLVAKGRRNIALIGGDLADPMRFTPPLYRRLGYLDALDAAELERNPDFDELGYYTIEGGARAMANILDLGQPDGVFAESDEMAFGAIRTIRRAGLRVPDDIAVIGFDDHPGAELMDLSTIRQNPARQGAVLASQILRVLARDEAEQFTPDVLPIELVVRGSTDPARSIY